MKKQWLAVTITIVLTTTALLTLLGLMGDTSSDISTSALAASPNQGTETSTSPPPTVTTINPPAGPNDIDMPIIIQGSSFTATLSGTLITAPTVFLGDAKLPGVIWVSTTTISATVPWGLEPDTYSLTVINPDGLSGTLQNAFTVTEGFGVFTTDGPYGGVIYDLHVNPLDPTLVYAVVYNTGLFISQDSGANWALALASANLENITFDAINKDIITVGGGGELYQSQNGGQSWEILVGRGVGASHLHHCYLHKPIAHPTNSGVFYDAVQKCPGSPVLPDLSGVYRVENQGSTWITRTNALTDTDVTALAVHPTDGGTLLVGTSSGNIFYSSDDGMNWTWKHNVGDYTNRELYFDPQSLDAWVLFAEDRFATLGDANNSMAVSTNINYSIWLTRAITGTNNWMVGSLDFTPGKVWAGAGDLFVSSDTGQSWTLITERDESGFKPDTYLFTINQNNPDIIYSDGHIEGIYKSVNGGVYWDRSSVGLAGFVPYDFAVYPANPDLLYVRAQGVGLLWTHNGGESWGITDFWNGGFPGPGFFAVDPITDTRLYLGDSVELQGRAGVGAADWVAGEWQTIYTSTFPLDEDECGSISALTPHPTLPGRLLAGVVTNPCDEEDIEFQTGTGYLFLSTDYGRNWQDVSPAESFGWTGHIVVSPKDPNRIYGCNNEGLTLRSDDAGDNWQIFPIKALSDTHASRIAVHPNDPDTVFVHYSSFTGSQLSRSTDGGQTWADVYDNGGEYVVITPPIPDAFGYILYIGCNFSEQLCRSTDNGNTWEVVPGAPRPTALAAGIEGQRVRLYIGSPGGATVAGGQSSPSGLSEDTVPGLGNVMGGGVYRLTTLLPDHWVYLPLVLRGHTP